MKFHPLFQTFLVEALENQTRGSQLASSEWKRAGWPVVVEEVNEARISDQIETRTRVEILKQLSAANARIAELEARVGHYCVHDGLWSRVAAGKDYVCPVCRNAALEEAAVLVENDKASWFASNIRKLKK